MSELLESRWQDTKTALLEGLQGTKKKSVMATTQKIQDLTWQRLPLLVQLPVCNVATPNRVIPFQTCNAHSHCK